MADTKVFVRGVDLESVSTDEVREYFEAAGVGVLKVLTDHLPRMCVVLDCRSVDDANRALPLNGATLYSVAQDACLLRVMPYAPKGGSPQRTTASPRATTANAASPASSSAELLPPDKRCVFVCQLDKHVVSAELEEFFGEAGPCVAELLPFTKTLQGQRAIIHFGSEAVARNAVRRFHQAMFTSSGSSARHIVVQVYDKGLIEPHPSAPPSNTSSSSRSFAPPAPAPAPAPTPAPTPAPYAAGDDVRDAALRDEARRILSAHGGTMKVTVLVTELRKVDPEYHMFIKKQGGAKRCFSERASWQEEFAVRLPPDRRPGDEVIEMIRGSQCVPSSSASATANGIGAPPSHSSSSSSSRSSRKSAPCRFFREGYCRNGSECKFLHDATSFAVPTGTSRHAASSPLGAAADAVGAASSPVGGVPRARRLFEPPIPPASNAGVVAAGAGGGLIQQVETVRRVLELDEALSVPAAVREANRMMGVTPPADAGLPSQVATLMAALGL
jgi:hypothetical protein